MNIPNDGFVRRGPACRTRHFAGLLALLVLTQAASAQTAVPPKTDAVKPAEEAVTLNVFEVSADKDDSYGALNSNSITRFNTELAKLPITADIYNEAFMRDTNSNSVEQMIASFTAGAGFSSSDGPASTLAAQPGDRASSSYIQLRGLTAPGMQRDAFMTLATFSNTGSTATGQTNNFDIERVEVIMGPQALLYGNGGGGGVVNLVSKQARFNRKSSGSFKLQGDQYGGTQGIFDYGVGNKTFAVRVALIEQNSRGRRENIKSKLDGQYVQLAARLFGNTVVRLIGEQTSNNRNIASNLNVVTLSAANDARNGQSIHYLLATNQLTASATGASGGGVIGNGVIDWDNVDSYLGWRFSERTIDTMATLTVETQWTRSISSQFAIGYKDFDNRLFNAGTLSLQAPNVTANYTGEWAVGGTGGQPVQESIQPAKTFPARFSVAFENELFGGRAKSQSIIGADYTRINAAYIGYGYYRADADWNPIVNPATALVNNGRTVIGPVIWPMGGGPLAYAVGAPGSGRLVWQGLNYVRMQQNPSLTSAITPQNPLGVTLGGGNYNLVRTVAKGVYGVNDTAWLSGRLHTLLGFRASSSFQQTLNQGSAITATNPDSGARKVSDEKSLSFSVGANYALREWLRPYFAVSDSHNPPTAQSNDPIGKEPLAAHSIGEEIGVKVQNAAGTISGSLALYHTSAKNETFFVTSTLAFVINPSGLNGRFGGAPSTIINVDRKSDGVQLALNASPTRNLRFRLSAAAIRGEIGNSRTYKTLYNDQFYANAAGQVTYKDGAVVYVNPTFTAARPTVPEGTAGAIPLTIAALSTAGNSYYANPIANSGQINATSARTTLAVVDAVHGPILTGATGLPISAIQINPGFTPPSEIPVTKAGEGTTNYPSLSSNLTGVYTVSSGFLNGLRMGGTANVAWFNRRYYYYPNGITVGGERRLFSFPTQARFDLLLGYEKRFGRYSLNTQLNVANMFNRYRVIITPSAINGYNGPNNAVFDGQPRAWTLSTTLGF
jgi:outer membrane receptor protein involved in Fe transport